MSRPLRYIPPGAVVEITSRTIQGRLLLRPSPEVNDVILGVLGRALALYRVSLHACVFMGNHLHLVASPANAAELAGFMRHLKRNISEEIGRLHQWRGPFWERRYRAIVIADEASQVDRLRYILEQGTKENLVESPRAWPGVHCVDALVEGASMSGTWLDRSGLYLARRRGHEVERSAFEQVYPVELEPLPCWQGLTECERRERYAAMVAEIEEPFEQVYPVELEPLPCWQGLTECERRERYAAMVAEIEEQAANVNAALDRRPVGAAFVMRQDPHSQPRSSSRSPAPLVHAASKRVREMFRAAYRQFVDAFRLAAERVRLGEYDVAFPLHSFPPPRPFVIADGFT